MATEIIGCGRVVLRSRRASFAVTLGAFGAAFALSVAPHPVVAVGGAPGSPDWPCPQRKVVKLSASDLQWEGDLGEATTSWRKDPAVSKLVEVLASRKTTLEDANAALKAYGQSVPEAQRGAKFTLVFAGLLDTVNTYRASVINGIERFNRRQKSRASEIEQEGLQLSELKKKLGPDPAGLPTSAPAAPTDAAAQANYDKALELYDWNVRVFEQRRLNLPIACDIPPAIDGRMFELVRTIRTMMKPAG